MPRGWHLRKKCHSATPNACLFFCHAKNAHVRDETLHDENSCGISVVGTLEQTVADARGYFSGWRSVTFDRIAGEGWSHKKSPRVFVSGTKTKPRKWARFVGQIMKKCRLCDHNAVLFFEPKLDPFSKTRAAFFGSSQAEACWQWHNFLAARAPPNKHIVRINMDESSLKLCPPARKGLVVPIRSSGDQPSYARQRKASLRDRRSALSLVAFIADDVQIQRALPQLILGNESSLPKRSMDELRSEPLACQGFFLLPRKSAWLDAACLVKIVSLLGAALRPFQDSHHILFCMDACPTHTHLKVVQECHRQNLYLFFIPASMTGYLQPLDTHVFAQYKHFLRTEHESQALATPDGSMRHIDMVKIMMRGIRTVLVERCWSHAFQQNGFSTTQEGVSKSLLKKLGYDLTPPVGNTLPTFHQWQLLFRRKSDIPFDALLRLCIPTACVPKEHVPAAPVHPVSAPGKHAWTHRLRSSSRICVDAQASASHPQLHASAADSHPDPVFPQPCPRMSSSVTTNRRSKARPIAISRPRC